MEVSIISLMLVSIRAHGTNDAVDCSSRRGAECKKEGGDERESKGSHRKKKKLGTQTEIVRDVLDYSRRVTLYTCPTYDVRVGIAGKKKVLVA